MAASNGDIKKVKSTIKQGADVNYHNPDYVSYELLLCKHKSKI